MPRRIPVYGEVNPDEAIEVRVNGYPYTPQQGLFYAEADSAGRV